MALPTLTRFEIVRALGEGGAGCVYEAHDRERGGVVALKVLRASDAEMLFRFKEEFRAMQGIEHPNLVRLFELVCDNGAWFLTMELIDGMSFVDYVSLPPGRAPGATDTGPSEPTASIHGEKGVARRFDEERLRSAAVQLAQGLVALHAAGKVHCDVKPSNVLVATDGRVVILDFGIVRDLGDPSAAPTDVVVGTAAYMAPEQAMGARVTPAADFYAMGAILFECLTGWRPFEGTASEILRRKVAEDAAPARTFSEDVPEYLNALCEELLERVPTDRPSGEDVIHRLLRRSVAGVIARSERPHVQLPFVGRTAELAELYVALARACAGDALTVIVRGESGIGKSATVRTFTEALRAKADVLVLSGRCHERESVPFKAVDGVVDALSSHLATLDPRAARALVPAHPAALIQAFPVLGRLPTLEDVVIPRSSQQAQERTRLFDAARELFTNVANTQPLVVVIDDLHWADADSLALLREVLRPPSPPRLLLVATAREPIASNGAKGGVRFGLPGEVRELSIGRLRADESSELVHLLAGDISPSVGLRIAIEAAGHPLFAAELVRHARFLGGRAPERVVLDEALVARASRLHSDARLLLEIVCVSATELAEEVLVRAVGLPFVEFSMHVHALRSAHLIRSDGVTEGAIIEPFHDRIREAIAASLDPPAQRERHARIAGALEKARRPNANALSNEWLLAGDTGRAGLYARRAGDEALAAFAFARATLLFQRALDTATLTPAERQELRVKLGDTLAKDGRGREAARAYSEAAVFASGESALELRRRSAEELLTAGLVDEGEVALDRVLKDVHLSSPRTALGALVGLFVLRLALQLRGLKFEERPEADASAYDRNRVDACNAVAAIFSAVDTIRGAYFQTRGVLAALSLGDAARLSSALWVEGAYLAAEGPRNAKRSAKLIARARAIAERREDVEALGRGESADGYAKFFLGRFPEARAHFEKAVRLLREHSPGAFWALRTAQLGAIWCSGWMGDLPSLVAAVDAALREAIHRGDAYGSTTVRTGVPNLTWLSRGDTRIARAHVFEAMSQWTQRGYHSQHYWSTLALSRIELYEGDAESAHMRVTREWSSIERARILNVRVMAVEALHLRASATIARALVGSGRLCRGLLRAAERDARRFDRLGDPLAVAYAHLTRGGVAAARGVGERAVNELRCAVSAFEALSMRLHAEAARWQLGRLVAGDEGAALMQSASAWMVAQGIADSARVAAVFAPGPRG